MACWSCQRPGWEWETLVLVRVVVRILGWDITSKVIRWIQADRLDPTALTFPTDRPTLPLPEAPLTTAPFPTVPAIIREKYV